MASSERFCHLEVTPLESKQYEGGSQRGPIDAISLDFLLTSSNLLELYMTVQHCFVDSRDEGIKIKAPPCRRSDLMSASGHSGDIGSSVKLTTFALRLYVHRGPP